MSWYWTRSRDREKWTNVDQCAQARPLLGRPVGVIYRIGTYAYPLLCLVADNILIMNTVYITFLRPTGGTRAAGREPPQAAPPFAMPALEIIPAI